MARTAICQVGHPGSLDSLTLMLRAVGWTVKVPGGHLRDMLKRMDCDTIISAAGMAQGWGGTLATEPHIEATINDLNDPTSIIIDTKAHRNGPKIWVKYPSFKNRTLWYRINGGRPCIVEGKGDEINPPCPVLTPDQWYQSDKPLNGTIPQSTLDKSYSCWPPYAKWNDHWRPRKTLYTPPVCMTHGLDGWGYGVVGEALRKSIGLRCFGGYGSPDGLYRMLDTPQLLSETQCLVHLKSQDCPGYSLYEALASGCPVVVSRMLIEWCKMGELFVEGETCLCYDRGMVPEPPGYMPIDTAECIREAEECVSRLKDPKLNQRIGEAGRERLRKIMWSPIADSSRQSLTEFMTRMFP